MLPNKFGKVHFSLLCLRKKNTYTTQNTQLFRGFNSIILREKMAKLCSFLLVKKLFTMVKKLRDFVLR
jgi:hypothetical protein